MGESAAATGYLVWQPHVGVRGGVWHRVGERCKRFGSDRLGFKSHLGHFLAVVGKVPPS